MGLAITTPPCLEAVLALTGLHYFVITIKDHGTQRTGVTKSMDTHPTQGFKREKVQHLQEMHVLQR